MTEPQARKKFGDENIKICMLPTQYPFSLLTQFSTDKSSFRALYFSMVEEEYKEPTVYKLICAGPEERVVGVHIIGMGSDEVMQGFAVAVKMGGKSFFLSIGRRGVTVTMIMFLLLIFFFFLFVARKQDLDDTVAIHPTSGEGAFFLRRKTKSSYLWCSPKFLRTRHSCIRTLRTLYSTDRVIQYKHGS